MKKILKIILIIFVLLLILIGGFIGFLFLQRDHEISKLPPYYQELAKECKVKEGGFGCCIASVKNMVQGNYRLIPEGGCLEGFQINRLECISSYTWCEPME